MLRRTRAALVTVAALGLGTTFVPAAQAADSVAIPLPTIQVQEVCGPRNDILTVDPAWLATWGDKVTIYPSSLTFQGGADGDYAKPAGQILEPYRSAYHWAGSDLTNWTSWDLYPGTITPILDANTPCTVTAPAPVLTQTAVRGPHNDIVALDAASAQYWTIVSQSWEGQRLTVTLQAKDGYVGPDGQTTATVVVVDQVNVGTR